MDLNTIIRWLAWRSHGGEKPDGEGGVWNQLRLHFSYCTKSNCPHILVSLFKQLLLIYVLWIHAASWTTFNIQILKDTLFFISLFSAKSALALKHTHWIFPSHECECNVRSHKDNTHNILTIKIALDESALLPLGCPLGCYFLTSLRWDRSTSQKATTSSSFSVDQNRHPAIFTDSAPASKCTPWLKLQPPAVIFKTKNSLNYASLNCDPPCS